MHLSLWILKNWLDEFEPELRSAQADESAAFIDEIRIEKARLYTSADLFDENTLYTGTSDSFYSDGCQQVVCRFGNSDLLLHTTDVTLVFNHILNAFYFYESWEKRMNLLIARQCSLTELLDESDEILMNPLLILDSSDGVLAISTAYANVEVDECRNELLASGATPPDKSVSFHRQGSTLFDPNNHNPFYIPSGFFPNGTWSQNIFRGQEWCGICVISEFHRPLDIGMMHLFYLFSQMIQHYTDTQSENNAFKLQSAFFLEAMKGEPQQISKLWRTLFTKQWNLSDQMILIDAAPLSMGYHTDAYLYRIFSRYSPHIFPAASEDHILLLCNISQLPKNDLLAFLRPWLKNCLYRCGVSQPFSDLAQLPAARRQAGIALQHGDPVAGCIYEAHDHMVYWLMETLKRQTDPSVIHPALNIISEYDQKHHAEYYQTLYTYLQNERNAILTAKQLNIHRNTLFHRLERIREKFCLDLEDPNERFYLILSFYYNMH